MWHLFKEAGNAFIGGFAGGFVILGGVLFGNVFNFAGDYILKLLLACIGALITGFFTAYGKYLFDKRQKKKDAKQDLEVKDKKRTA